MQLDDSTLVLFVCRLLLLKHSMKASHHQDMQMIQSSPRISHFAGSTTECKVHVARSQADFNPNDLGCNYDS
jgi:hypothetical protein